MGTDHLCVNEYAGQGESSDMSELQLCRAVRLQGVAEKSNANRRFTMPGHRFYK